MKALRLLLCLAVAACAELETGCISLGGNFSRPFLQRGRQVLARLGSHPGRPTSPLTGADLSPPAMKSAARFTQPGPIADVGGKVADTTRTPFHQSEFFCFALQLNRLADVALSLWGDPLPARR